MTSAPDPNNAKNTDRPKPKQPSDNVTDNVTDNDSTDTTPHTDVSLVCQNPKKRHYKKDDNSFFMMKSYQILIALSLLIGAGLVVVYQTLFAASDLPEQLVEIPEGQTYYGLVTDWQDKTPLFSASLAKLYIKSQVDAPLHAGNYKLPANRSFVQTLGILGQGADAAMVQVQIIEGKTAKDIYATLKSTDGIVIEALKQPDALKQTLGIHATTPTGKYANNLEGWFAPETYLFAEGSTDTQILTQLYDKQQTALDTAWAGRDADLPYNTPYDALIMASIIEKETSVPSERPLVAAVFVNRLRQGMRLQTDPTIIYGMGERYDGNIRRADINEKTDYNTYQIDGLPPTPIALPSAASIEAAVHPADSDVLYFVATGKGGHKFSKTLSEHNQAVRDYLNATRGQ